MDLLQTEGSVQIHIRHLNSTYQEQPCLQDICLDMAEGQIFALVGPNGCGKTTLLRHISGVIQNKETLRAIQLDMRELGTYAAQDLAKVMAAVEQHIQPGFEFSVRDVVALGRIPHLRRWQSMRGIDREVVERVLAQTSLLSLAERSIFQLSSGERQRVWLALALAQEPQVLLLDEPTSHLDLHFQIEMFEMLRQLSVQGLTVVMAIHDLNLTLLYAQQVGLMCSGQLLAVGTPETVFTPENIAAAFAIEMQSVRDSQTGRLVGLLPTHRMRITSPLFPSTLPRS